MNLVRLTHGPAVQTIWARDSYAMTVARMTFARAHGIAPAEVDVTIEYAEQMLQQAPTRPLPTHFSAFSHPLDRCVSPDTKQRADDKRERNRPAGCAKAAP